jgi:UDP-N-acetylglucosamine--N-acetylmuramyl-(pentapeptide) pyrophosphoryl-undecaprenol N-acetylglucosamine transferase
MTNKPTIILSGGGTLGSVTPLLALVKELSVHYQLAFIGTDKGIEKDLVEQQQLTFYGIVGGKLRRYWSWRNLVDPVLIAYGFVEAIFILRKLKPQLIISAGSFISVGVVVAGKLLGIKSIIIQLDIVPGLANRLMSKFADSIAVTLSPSLNDFKSSVLTGAPIPNSIIKIQAVNPEESKRRLGLKANLPTVLILGGGTGSVAINKLVTDNLFHLTQICQIIHLTGRNKSQVASMQNYLTKELMNELEIAEAYNASDLVVSRAGMGVLIELGALSKPAIIIPMPRSHQERNAQYFADRSACVVLKQNKTSSWDLLNKIKHLLADSNQLKSLGDNLHQSFIPHSNANIVKLIDSIINR